MLADKISMLLQSPITWGVVALGFAAIAISGRFSVTLSNIILVIAFFVGCFGIYRSGLNVYFLIIFCLLLAAMLVFVSWWINPNLHKEQSTQEIPSFIKSSLVYDPFTYNPGMEVDGVKWQKNYQQYSLIIANENNKTEFYDIRIYCEFPWAIIKYDIESNQGTQELKLSQDKLTPGGIVNKNSSEILKTVEFYYSSLHADAVKFEVVWVLRTGNRGL